MTHLSLLSPSISLLSVPSHTPFPCIPACASDEKTVKIYIYKSLSSYLSSVFRAFPFLSEKDYGKTNSLTSTHYRILSPFLKNSTKAPHQQNLLCKGKQSPCCLKPTEAWIQQARKSGFRAPNTGSERLWPHDTNADLMWSWSANADPFRECWQVNFSWQTQCAFGVICLWLWLYTLKYRLSSPSSLQKAEIKLKVAQKLCNVCSG